MNPDACDFSNTDKDNDLVLVEIIISPLGRAAQHPYYILTDTIETAMKRFAATKGISIPSGDFTISFRPMGSTIDGYFIT